MPGTASAQVLLGIVVEEGARSPVSQAELSVIDAAGVTRATALSDSTGFFRIAVPEAGRWVLRVSHIAFTEFTSDTVTISYAETIDIEIRLGRAVIPIEPLIVRARSRQSARVAEFQQRLRSRNFGRFVTRAELERRANARVTDILRTIPGVSMVPVRARGRSGPERWIVAMRGSVGVCEPAIWIDGVRTRQQGDSTLDELLSPDHLEGVEVYTSTAGAPAQYTVLGACGVILFWTRQGETGEKFSWKRLLIGVAAIATIIIILR